MTNVTNRPGDDPWAQREASFRLYVEPPAVAFFIPGIDDPAEAEAQWARFAQGHRPDSRRVYSLTYFNGISKIEVKLQELEETSFWLELLVKSEIVPPNGWPTCALRQKS